jgi:tetratricopeptide (TPR) repeat protein
VQESIKRGTIFESYELLFQIYRSQGKKREAANKLREGYERFSNAPDSAALKLVDYSVENGMLQEAENFFEKNQNKMHEDSSRMFCRARINEGKGKVADAEAQYKTLLRSDPTFIYALERLYQILRVKGKVEELEEIAQAGLKKNSQLGLYHNVLGVIHKKAGRFSKAVVEYNEALQIEPDNGMYMANLGAAYLSMEQPEKALEVLQKARQRNEQDPEVWINLGAVYGALGQTTNGLDAFHKVRSLGVDSPNVELGIAALYAQQGQLDEAIKVLEKATLRFPGNPDLKEFLRMLKQEARQKGV